MEIFIILDRCLAGAIIGRSYRVWLGTPQWFIHSSTLSSFNSDRLQGCTDILYIAYYIHISPYIFALDICDIDIWVSLKLSGVYSSSSQIPELMLKQHVILYDIDGLVEHCITPLLMHWSYCSLALSRRYGYIENNVCARVTNCFSAHKRVISVIISRVAKQRGE